MIGPERCLVDTFSATSCLPSNIRLDHSIPITRTHSDLVKFTHRDAEFDSIVFALEQILRGPSAHRDCRYEMDEKDRECVKDLHTTDPWLDKQRIEKTKGGLLNDSYLWILDSPDFRLWRHDEASRLLWIRGDPGKGKTMLLCGIIDELHTLQDAAATMLSFFFCQAADARINNAISVLRGLIYLLVKQRPALVSHIREKYDDTGKPLFDGLNAWTALSDILINILSDLAIGTTYLIIDALDECIGDLPQLLDLIVRTAVSARVKWIVSSRNWPEIEE
jgi:hypothetical protein